jgi:energy-coupling factor transport system permease protein
VSLPASLYVPGDSWLHRLDPRVKLAFAVCATLALLTLGSLPLFLLSLALCHAMLLSAHVPAGRLSWAWRMMLPITILIPVLWPLFTTAEGALLFQVGPLMVTWPDVWQGLAAAFRVNALAFAFFVWLFTTDQTGMVLGFVGMGIPYDWGLALAITLRYIPTLSTTLERVMDAQRARGLVTSYRNPLRAARAYIPALVPMLISALRTAENLSRALEARAFGVSGRRRTSRRRLHFTRRDGVVLAATVFVCGALIAARLAWGFGAGPLL